LAVPVKRRDASFFLLPLIAAMVFYPSGSPRVSTGSSEIVGSQDKPRPNIQPNPPAEWERGRQAVRWFFNPPAGAKWDKDPRDKATVKFLIATVPDPVDSGLAHVYDRYMGSILAAVNSQPYFLSKFDLPWEDCLAKGKEKEKEDKEAGSEDQNSLSQDQPDAACKVRRYRKEPGFLLLSNPTGKSPTSTEDQDKSRTDLLLVYLVGETSAAGIQKRALYSALNEISWFCRWRESSSPSSDATLRSMARCGANEVRILGPSYSGSAQSLDLALSAWVDSISHPGLTLRVSMISGSATAVYNPDENAVEQKKELAKSDFYNIRQRLNAGFSFRSMVIPDEVANSKLCSFLLGPNKPKRHNLRMAVLIEGSTAYGNRQVEELSKPAKEESACDDIERTILPYPAHISQLRAVSEKLRQSQRDGSPEAQVSSKNLPLAESLEDAGTRRDLKTFSPASAVTAEQVMANLLFTISRERFDYVGIVATDTRDTMFLAQEVREHSPSTVLFTYGGDLLFLHPEINQTLRGMLIVSSYPVNNAFQSWMSPPDFGARLQFPDDGSEGVYNATLALLNDDHHLVEFSSPLPDTQMKTRPAVWITVVGRNRLWPVTTFDLSFNANAERHLYVPGADISGKVGGASLWQGLYSEGTLILAGAFAVLCVGFGLPLLKRFGRESGARRRGFLGAVVSDKHHRAGELALLAGCASLGTFLIILVTTLCIPVGAIRLYTNQGKGLPWEAIAAILFVCVASIVLGTAGVAVLRGVLKKRQSAERTMEWAPFAAGSAACVSLAFALASEWIFEFGWGDRLAAVFASLRSLNMFSGVSALTPLLFISIAGFVWAVATYKRIHLLDDLEERSEETVFNHLKLSEVRRLYDNLRFPSLDLPASRVVLALAGLAGLYLWFHLVHSLEFGWFYTLLVVSFFFVSLALWQAVLRFWLVWSETHRFLRHLALTPLCAACKRFRESYPVLPKIDLASSAASLARLECSTQQARTLFLRATRVTATAQVMVKASSGATLIMMDPVEFDALIDLKSDAMKNDIDGATSKLERARDVGAQEGEADLNYECESRKALSEVTERVAKALQNSWWTEIQERPGEEADPVVTERANVFALAEEFLAGRVAHSLACVFQHMQNLIGTAVIGLLLLLFAVSSYPFQPHNVLLLFNWIIILSVVGIALWVFIQMRRDPILSYLSGTKPGEIGWDSEFIFRVFTYAIVPILALLGAQFPQSVRQILSHLMSGDASHS
jgi:hypothetical protein